MKKVKTFFHILFNSLIPNAPYYHKIKTTPLSFSLKYFLALVVFVNAVSFFILSVRFPPQKINQIKTSVVESLNSFPDNLKISLENRVLTTNANRPYLFWIDFNSNKYLLFVIDENAPAVKITEYHSYLLFTKSKIVVNVKKIGRFDSNVLSYPQNWKLHIGKSDAMNRAEHIENISFAQIALFFLLVLPFLRTFLFILYISILSVFCFLIYSVFSRKHSLSKTFQVSLHAFTLPFILDAVLFTMGKTAPFSFILFLILILVFILSALYEMYYRDK